MTVLFWLGSPKLIDALMLRNAKKILFKEGKNNILGERILFFAEDSIRTSTKWEENKKKHRGRIKSMKED